VERVPLVKRDEDCKSMNALYEGQDYFFATYSEVCVNELLVCEYLFQIYVKSREFKKKALQRGARALTHHHLSRPISA